MRKICVFTSTRAEYGLLSGLMRKLKNDPQIELQILVSGTHLEKSHGETWTHIVEDGFTITQKVPIELKSNTAVGICYSQGTALIRYAEALDKMRPDIAIVLGDRFEALSFATACVQLSIPLAHLHGGELTLGATDDAMRHAISKFSYWHFTAAEEYRKRLIRMGEHPERVYNVGALGVENIKTLKLLPKEEIERNLNFRFLGRNILVTFHPETNTQQNASDQIHVLLTCLEKLVSDTLIIFTMPNADKDSEIIRKQIEQFVAGHPSTSVVFHSMGYLNYLSSLQYVDVMVGNSSSGILEAPSFGLPTVNIGERQSGRIRAKSVLDCSVNEAEIDQALQRALTMKRELNDLVSPFDGGESSKRVLEVLKSQQLPVDLRKEFYE